MEFDLNEGGQSDQEDLVAQFFLSVHYCNHKVASLSLMRIR